MLVILDGNLTDIKFSQFWKILADEKLVKLSGREISVKFLQEAKAEP